VEEKVLPFWGSDQIYENPDLRTPAVLKYRNGQKQERFPAGEKTKKLLRISYRGSFFFIL